MPTMTRLVVDCRDGLYKKCLADARRMRELRDIGEYEKGWVCWLETEDVVSPTEPDPC